jgi:hypothetical protein
VPAVGVGDDGGADRGGLGAAVRTPFSLLNQYDSI